MAAVDIKKWMFENALEAEAHEHRNYLLTWRDGQQLHWSGFDVFHKNGAWRHREFNGFVDGELQYDNAVASRGVLSYKRKFTADKHAVHPMHHELHASIGDAVEPVRVDDGTDWTRLLIDAYGEPWMRTELAQA